MKIIKKFSLLLVGLAMVMSSGIMGSDRTEAKATEAILAGQTNGMYIDNDGVLHANDKGISGLSFNFKKSRYYYVEMQMDPLSTYYSDQIIGLSHNLTNNGIPTGGLYYNGFKFNSGSFEMAHSRYISDWWEIGGKRLWMDKPYGTRDGVEINFNTPTKLAVARVGYDFYTFINDKVYAVAQYPELMNYATYPGMVFQGADQQIHATFRNFNFIKSKNDIVSKVNELKGTTQFDYYYRYGGSYEMNYAAFDAKDGFTYKQEATLNNDMNASMVSPYVHAYTKQWKMEFDMQTTALGDDGKWGKIIFDLRTLHDFKAVFNWNLRPSADGTINEHNSTSCEVGTIITADTMSNLFTGINSKEKTHITIERRPKTADNQMTFMFRIKQDGVAEKNSYIVIIFKSDSLHFMESPFFLVIHSQKWAGTITNFKFTNLDTSIPKPSYTASNFVTDWSNMRGTAENDQFCATLGTTQMDELIARYDALEDVDNVPQDIVDAVEYARGVKNGTIQTSQSAGQGTSGVTLIKNSDTYVNTYSIVLLSLGFVTVLGYYLVQKRKATK